MDLASEARAALDAAFWGYSAAADRATHSEPDLSELYRSIEVEIGKAHAALVVEVIGFEPGSGDRPGADPGLALDNLELAIEKYNGLRAEFEGAGATKKAAACKTALGILTAAARRVET